MSSEGLHESLSDLSETTVDRHRAIASLMEELEAVDWYDQRVEATGDRSLAEVLAHNRDEEKEHAAMTLEWLRRNDAAFDRHLRTYLFTDEPLLVVESRSGSPSEDAEDTGPGEHGSLMIGSLRGNQ